MNPVRDLNSQTRQWKCRDSTIRLTGRLWVDDQTWTGINWFTVSPLDQLAYIQLVPGWARTNNWQFRKLLLFPIESQELINEHDTRVERVYTVLQTVAWYRSANRANVGEERVALPESVRTNDLQSFPLLLTEYSPELFFDREGVEPPRAESKSADLATCRTVSDIAPSRIRTYTLHVLSVLPHTNWATGAFYELMEGFEPPRHYWSWLQIRCYQPLSDISTHVPLEGFEPTLSTS